MSRNNRARNRIQMPKQRTYRSQVALDALGVTDGNRRSTRHDNDSRRMGTKRAIINAAMAE